MNKQIKRAAWIFVYLVGFINVFRIYNIITLTELTVGAVLSFIITAIYFILSKRKKQ